MKRTIEVSLITFCENCAKHRRIALVSVGQWFVWMCIPCQFKYELKGMWRRLREELHFQRVEAREAKADR